MTPRNTPRNDVTNGVSVRPPNPNPNYLWLVIHYARARAREAGMI